MQIVILVTGLVIAILGIGVLIEGKDPRAGWIGIGCIIAGALIAAGGVAV